jgi:L-ascorbate peroxidase
MDDKPNTGIPGGISWTKQWLKFDNSYFSRIHSSEDYANLLWLPTDIALLESPEFKVHFMRYANSEIAFFDDYTEAHIKMSELGCKFSPPEGIIISNNSSSNNSISP